jgi:hypothetical protein
MRIDRRQFLRGLSIGSLSTVGSGLGLGTLGTLMNNNDHRNPSLRNLVDYHDDNLDDSEVDGINYQLDNNGKPERILALSFGNNTEEGSSNYQLATSVKDGLTYYNEHLPVYTQKEVAEVLDQFGIESQPLSKVGEMSRDYADTTEMLRRLKALSSGAKGDNVLMAHPAHLERVMYLADNSAIQTSPFLNSKMGWNEEDEQPWVTSPGLWVPREISIRLYDMARL